LRTMSAVRLAELAGQVLAHRSEHAGQQLVGLGQAHPPDVLELVTVSDEDVGVVDTGRLRGHVDHRAAGLRVHPLADHIARLDPHPGLPFALGDGGVLRRLVFDGILPPRDERPWRLAITALANQDAALGCDDRGDDGLYLALSRCPAWLPPARLPATQGACS